MQHHKNRIWSVDIIRGFFINLMMIAHAIFFFHTQTNQLLIITNRFIDIVTFTGLLLLSGMTGYIAYIHFDHPTISVIKRITKRLSVYLFGYYLLAILAHTTANGWNYNEVIQILTFSRLVPFTEFIIPFLMFGIIKIPFRKAYARISQSLVHTLLVGVIIFLIAAVALTLSFPQALIPLKVLLIGQKSTYSFPLLQYMPVYLLGLYLGKWHWDNHHKETVLRHLKHIIFGLGISLVALVLVSLIPNFPLTQFDRWPPSLSFIVAGSLFTLCMIWFIETAHNLYRTPWIRNYLLISGQNAFALFLTHTLVLYIFQALHIMPAYSTLLVAVLWLTSVAFALYLAKIIPLNYQFSLTFIRWCDCQAHSCSHAAEHRIIVRLKHLALQIVNLPELFAIKIGRRRIKPLKIRTVASIVGLFIITATPLGIAENYLTYTNTLKELSGETNRTWIIPQRTQEIIYSISLPDSVSSSKDLALYYQVDNQTRKPLSSFGNTFTAHISSASLDPGEHKIRTIIQTPRQDINTHATTIFITEPLYITWTMDWEGYDVSDSYLDALISMSEKYSIPMTHLFNPRIYTAPDIPESRAEYLTQWVINRRDIYGEEIGLHLHMFFDFVEAAGLEPKSKPFWGDADGYDILTTAYSTDEMVQLLNYAKNIFLEKNLGIPKSYRAGGWFANIDTLTALEKTSFLLDSSARTKYIFGKRNTSGFWDISPTTQPYFPSIFDQNSPEPKPQLSLLEIPNNGADTYAFSAQEIIKRFQDNFPDNILTEKRQVTFLTHPQWFNPLRQAKTTQVFDEVNKYRYDNDTGPVIPTNLSGIYQAWIQ